MRRATLLFGNVFILTVFLVACNSEVKPPKRLASIPPEAVWAGGIDGGDWFLCRVEKKQNYCVIYHDFTGAIVAKGYFFLRGTNRAATEQELKYRFFDGAVIHLDNGKVLEPIPGKVDFPA